MIEREGPDTVAAFIAEPVMGAGGVIVPPRGYFEKIKAVCRRHDVYMIADEVICGFGRLGTMFGCETFGLRRIRSSVAKALTSAYLPIAAADRRRSRCIRRCSSRAARSAPSATASPIRAIRWRRRSRSRRSRSTSESDIVAQSARKGAAVPGAAAARSAEHPLVGEARGIGLIGARRARRRQGEQALVRRRRRGVARARACGFARRRA